MSNFSTAIRTLRGVLNLTQPAFAKKLRMSAATISHYESGDRMPDAEARVRLCRAALDAGKIELAEVFAAKIPGVADGLLIPRWRTEKSTRKAGRRAASRKSDDGEAQYEMSQ